MHRALDIAAASVGLAVASPVIALAGLAIYLEDGWPVFYRHMRIGRGGVPFGLYKLRSMTRNASGPAITAAGDRRVTRVGRWIRKYKLDELPQLWNVLIGDMSLIGPRPEAPAYVDLDAPEWRETLSCRPGITDLATLMYRNEEALLGSSSNPEQFYREQILPHKLQLNREFLRRRTFWLEIKLIVLSVRHSFWPQDTV